MRRELGTRLLCHLKAEHAVLLQLVAERSAPHDGHPPLPHLVGPLTFARSVKEEHRGFTFNDAVFGKPISLIERTGEWHYALPYTLVDLLLVPDHDRVPLILESGCPGEATREQRADGDARH